MDTEDQIQKSKIKNEEKKLYSHKYNIKKQNKFDHKNYNIYIYMKFALKIGSFFQGNSSF